MKFEHAKSSNKKVSKHLKEKALQRDSKDSKDSKDEKFDFKKEIFTWIEMLLFSLVTISLVLTFAGRMMKVNGASMEPTLHNNEKIITTNLHGKFKHGDIVTLKRKDDTAVVKRIIALEGDKLDIDFLEGRVYLNDKLLNEPFIAEPTHNAHDFQGPVTIPAGHVFVMGDNRNYSDDSRFSKIGMIDERNIYGKVIFRVYPLKAFGIVK